MSGPKITLNGRELRGDELLTPTEVAVLFRVNPKTVSRWAKAGKLDCIQTLGGHRRYRAADVGHLLNGLGAARKDGEAE